jgi:hypothetical protein
MADILCNYKVDCIFDTRGSLPQQSSSYIYLLHSSSGNSETFKLSTSICYLSQVVRKCLHHHKTTTNKQLPAADLPVQQVAHTTGMLAGTGSNQIIHAITPSMIVQMSCAPIVWSVTLHSKLRHPLTTVLVRTPPPLKAVCCTQQKSPGALKDGLLVTPEMGFEVRIRTPELVHTTWSKV